MTRVELTLAAVEDLDRLIITHSLPVDTHMRVRRSLGILELFPSVGRQLGRPWDSICFILGPWRWLLIVYLHDEQQDVVSILTIQDARSSIAVTNLIDPR
jgi:hypothetical protein